MDDKRIERLRSDKEINLELEDVADAWKRFVKRYTNDITGEIEKPTIKTEWLKKKTR